MSEQSIATNSKDAPPAARAVLLDTNAFDLGNLNDASIAKVREFTSRGAIVFVPDFVVLELAYHTWSAISTGIWVLREMKILSHELSQEEVEQSAIRRLEEAGAKILTSDCVMLKDALRAQVLRIRPANAKKASDGKSIQTGAVDYLVVEHAKRLSRTHPPLLVISADKEVVRALEEPESDENLYVDTAKSLRHAREQIMTGTVDASTCRDLLIRVSTESYTGTWRDEGKKQFRPCGVTFIGSTEDGYAITVAWNADGLGTDVHAIPSFLSEDHFKINPNGAPMEVLSTFPDWEGRTNASRDDFLLLETSLFPPQLRPRVLEPGEAQPLGLWCSDINNEVLFGEGDVIISKYTVLEDSLPITTNDPSVKEYWTEVEIRDSQEPTKPLLKGAFFTSAVRHWRSLRERATLH